MQHWCLICIWRYTVNNYSALWSCCHAARYLLFPPAKKTMSLGLRNNDSHLHNRNLSICRAPEAHAILMYNYRKKTKTTASTSQSLVIVIVPLDDNSNENNCDFRCNSIVWHLLEVNVRQNIMILNAPYWLRAIGWYAQRTTPSDTSVDITRQIRPE